MSLFQA